MFLASSWVEAWSESYLPGGRWRPPCRYLTVREESGRLAGVFPFATMRFGPIAFAAAGGYPVPYRGVAVDTALLDATCESLARKLRLCLRNGVGVRIGPVSADDRMTQALASALRRQGWQVGTRVLGRSFIVDLPSTAARFTETSRGIIKRAAYHERRLNRTGRVEVIRYNGLAIEAWEKVLDDAAAIERRSWVAGKNGVLHFATPRSKRFWRRALEDEHLAKSIAIWILYLDGRPISLSLNLDAGRTRYIIANLFDEAFKIHSCGTILAHHVLRDAIERGSAEIDWGQGDPGYKQQWLARPGPAVHDVIALRPGLASIIGRGVLHRRSGYFF